MGLAGSRVSACLKMVAFHAWQVAKGNPVANTFILDHCPGAYLLGSMSADVARGPPLSEQSSCGRPAKSTRSAPTSSGFGRPPMGLAAKILFLTQSPVEVQAPFQHEFA